MTDDYNKEILKENNYIVELSNEGGLIKPNPNFFNTSKNKLQCVESSCTKLTAAKYRLCGEHNKLKHYPLHSKDWLGRVILPNKNRNDCKTWAIPHSQISFLLIGWIGNNNEKAKKMDSFIDDILVNLHKIIPNATVLQDVFMGRNNSEMHPDIFADITLKLVNKHFPEAKYKGDLINGNHISFKQMSFGMVPLRVVLASQILAFGCEEANRGDARGSKLSGIEPRYANMFMPLSLYLLLRKGATLKEAVMCSK